MKEILFGDLSREYASIKVEIDLAIQRVLDRGHFILGEECESFEKAFAAFCSVKYCVGVASGTDAIALSLMALNIGSADFVITVPNTAVPTVSAISMVGAEPLFVDIDEKTMLLSVDKLKYMLVTLPKEKLNRTKAVVPVHLYGMMCQVDEIKEAASKYNIDVIEDCAQSHGAMYNNKIAGSAGVLGCFSFYPSKNLGCYGDGGCVVTDNEDLYQRLIMLRNYGQKKRYDHKIFGVNSRLDEIQAAILKVKLGYLDEWNNKRIQLGEYYRKGLKEYPVSFQKVSDRYTKHVYHLLVLRCNRRDELMGFLSKNGIQSLIHYPVPIYLQDAYKYLGLKEGSCPIAENTCKEILSLPLYPYLKEEELNIIINTIKRFFG